MTYFTSVVPVFAKKRSVYTRADPRARDSTQVHCSLHAAGVQGREESLTIPETVCILHETSTLSQNKVHNAQVE